LFHAPILDNVNALIEKFIIYLLLACS